MREHRSLSKWGCLHNAKNLHFMHFSTWLQKIGFNNKVKVKESPLWCLKRGRAFSACVKVNLTHKCVPRPPFWPSKTSNESPAVAVC